MLAAQIVLSMALVVSGALWAYATLLVFFIYLEEIDSLYFHPMRMALNRFVESLGMGWLKPLHHLSLPQRRSMSYGLFVIVTVQIGLLLWLTE